MPENTQADTQKIEEEVRKLQQEAEKPEELQNQDLIQEARTRILQSLERAPETKQELFEKLRKNPTILCGGGGLYGFKSLGVLKALHQRYESEGVLPKRITMTGSSAGSFLAAAYATRGPELFEDLNIVKPLTNVFELKPRSSHLANPSKLDVNIKACLGRKLTFQDCKAEYDENGKLIKPEVELKIVVYDFVHHQPIILDRSNYDGPLWLAVRASCTIPGVFDPVRMRKNKNGKYEIYDKEEGVRLDEYKQEWDQDGDAFEVVDGSFVRDIPYNEVKTENTVHPISIEINPGSKFLKEHDKEVRQVKSAISAIRKGTGKIPKGIQKTLAGLGRKLGSSVPVVTARVFANQFFSEHGENPEQVKEPSAPKDLIRITPETKELIPPIGKISDEDMEKLVHWGEEAGNQTIEANDLVNKMRQATEWNRKLEELLGLQEEEKEQTGTFVREEIIRLVADNKETRAA